MSNVIHLEQLSLTYEDRLIFHELTTNIKEKEFVSILGPSGCGKSSLLNILSGTLTPSGGHFAVDGVTVTGLNDHFSYMPQEDLLFDWKTVYDNITLYQTLHHLPIDHQAIDEYLKIFGLTEVKHALPTTLSGGMRQRVAFLRTVLVDRDILLLDEPFGALDIFTRQQLQDWLKTISSQLNKTIILVTHDIDEALYLSDRILIMGHQPSTFVSEMSFEHTEQTREWLADQGALRYSIYQHLAKVKEV